MAPATILKYSSPGRRPWRFLLPFLGPDGQGGHFGRGTWTKDDGGSSGHQTDHAELVGSRPARYHRRVVTRKYPLDPLKRVRAETVDQRARTLSRALGKLDD